MSWSVTLNGRTYTEVNVEGTAYADEANGLPAMFQDFAADAGFAKGAGVTSATNLTPATGTLVFTTDQDASTVSIPVGILVKAESAVDSGKFAIGTVTGFAGTSLTIDATVAAGAAASDWTIAHAATPRINRLFEALDANGQDIAGAGSVAATTVTATTATVGALTATGLASHHAGSAHAELDLGTLNANPAAIGAVTESYVGGVVAGNITVPVAGAPTMQVGGVWRRSGYGKIVTLTQDGTGGRDVQVQKANELIQSNALNTAPWTKATGGSLTLTVTEGALAAVNGIVSLNNLVIGGSGSDFANVGQTRTVAGDTVFTLQAKLKANASNWALLQIGGPGIERVRAYFDLSTGTQGAQTVADGAVSSVSAAPVDLGDGVYLCSVTGTFSTSTTVVAALISLASADNAEGGVVPGDSLYAADAQLVPGAGALDYIPVGASRAAVWSGPVPAFSGQAAGTKTRFSVQVGPDGDLETSLISEV